MFRYFTRELIAKGALRLSSLPEFLKDARDEASDHNAFTPRQYERFSTGALKTGAWFLDCSATFVPTEEHDLAVSLGILSAPQARIDIEDDADDDDAGDFVDEVPRPAPKVGKKRAQVPARPRPAPKNAPLAQGGPSSQAESGPSLTQASERLGDVAGSPSQAARFNRLVRGRDTVRPDLSETIPANVSTLPIFLEHGDMSEVLNLSETNCRMEPQAVRIMQHIRKVIPVSYIFILFSTSLSNRDDFITLIIVLLCHSDWERS